MKAKWIGIGAACAGAALMGMKLGMASGAFGAGLILSGTGTALIGAAGERARIRLEAAFAKAGGEMGDIREPSLRAEKIAGGAGLALWGMSFAAHIAALLLAFGG